MANVPILSDLIEMGMTTAGMQMKAIDLLEDALSGDMDRDSIRKFWSIFSDAASLTDEHMRVMVAGAVLAASIATGQIMTSFESGKLAGLLDTRVGSMMVSAYGWLDAHKTRMQTELDRVKGHLDWEQIQASYDRLQLAHEIGLTFSPTYRDQVEQFYNDTAALSQRVFGQTNSLFHGLALVQMVTNDTASLRGVTREEGEGEYLRRAVDISEQVNRKASQYARNGGAFWADLQLRWMNTLTSGLYAGRRAQEEQMTTTRVIADQARTLTAATSENLREYRTHLDPYLSDKNLRELDTIRRDFDRDIRRPVKRLADFVDDTWPAVEEQTAQLEENQATLAAGTLEALERTAFPDSLTEPQAAAQSIRINSLMDSAMVQAGGAQPVIARDMRIVRSIFDILEER